MFCVIMNLFSAECTSFFPCVETTPDLTCDAGEKLHWRAHGVQSHPAEEVDDVGAVSQEELEAVRMVRLHALAHVDEEHL